jgi:cytochrome P450
MNLGGEPALFINHPDLIKDVLVTKSDSFHKGFGLEQSKKVLGSGLLTSEGSEHLTQRRLIQPCFHRERIAGYATIATTACVDFEARWKPGSTVDIPAEMLRLTLGIVGKTLFGADIDADEIGAIWPDLIAGFNLSLLPFGNFWQTAPLPASIRYRAALRRLDTLIFKIIKSRAAPKGPKSDLLSMLLSARDDHDNRRAMTPKQVRDEIVTFMMAGHETTANALAWTWALLSQHPNVSDKLDREIAGVVGDRLPTYDDIPHLVYTRQIISETLRLYPPPGPSIGERSQKFRLGVTRFHRAQS